MTVRHRIFLSSTELDLGGHRDAAIHVAQRLGAEIVAMEDFGPDPRAAAAVCRQKVRSCDLFLGLYAYRYGFQPDGFGGVSMTELEYRWAIEEGIPVLLFIADEDHPWPPKLMDGGGSRARVEGFKAELRLKHVVAPLTTPERLREDLFVHLPRFQTESPARDAEAVATVLPIPPRPYFAHAYTLLQTEQVIGRARELAALDGWVGDAASPYHAARILCLVAIGGMGKSALSWKWLQDHAPRVMQPLSGRLWWSFYEADADFDRFLTAALAYCTGRPLHAVGRMARTDRESELLAVLGERPFLLVLDGVERLLIAYAGSDFAHMPDEDLDARTANPIACAGKKEPDRLRQHRLRKTIDPGVGNFFRKLSRVQASRVLVTTRLYPSELQTDTGREIPGTAAVHLHGLEPEDALALWRGMGVSGSDAELDALFATFEYYPLLIRALSGEVARFRAAPGDFDAWRAAHPTFDPFSIPLVQAKSHVLAHSLGNIDPEAMEVLYTIAAFRTPVDYATLFALFARTRAGRGGTAEELDAILTPLEDRGLVGWDRAGNQYDLHPVVRGVVWTGLDQAKRDGVYVALRSHFESFPTLSGPRTVGQARPVLDLFDALVGLGHLKQAMEVYFGRIHGLDFIAEGALPLQIRMFESWFEAGAAHPPEVTRHPDAYIQLAHAYYAAGRLEDARRCYAESIDISERTRNQPMGYNYLSQAERLLGRLKEALVHADRKAPRDPEKLVLSNRALCKAVVGDVDAARATLERLAHYYRFGVYLAQIALWEGEHALAAQEAVTALEGPVPLWIGDRLLCGAVLGDAWTHLGETARAEPLLKQTLTEAIEKSVPRFELEARRALAELHRVRGELAQAREVLDDLWELATRGGFRLTLADAHLVLAAIERDAGQVDAAREAAREAYTSAWCDGPPHAYHWTLQKAAAMISELGAEIPALEQSAGGPSSPLRRLRGRLKPNG